MLFRRNWAPTQGAEWVIPGYGTRQDVGHRIDGKKLAISIGSSFA